MGIFKPCDIRGIYNRELTDQDAYDLGRAAGRLTQGQTALVAGDVRLSTPAFPFSPFTHRRCTGGIEGLLGNGSSFHYRTYLDFAVRRENQGEVVIYN